MKSFKQILQDKPIYPFDPSPQVSQHLEKHVSDAVRELITQQKDLIDNDPQNSYLESRAQHRFADDLLKLVSSVQRNICEEGKKEGDKQ